jgi:3-hydroxyacyl-[acyl-carrier-protein] dehydratase
MRLEYFQMIDRFVAVDVPGRVARAVCTVPLQSPVFEGHFPGYPLMPGVLLIECMAQTTGWLVSALTGFTGLPALAGVKEGKIRTAVFPGDELEFEGRVIHEGSGYAIGEAKGWCKGTAVCDATLTYRIVPYPSVELRAGLWEWAERINFPAKEFAK